MDTEIGTERRDFLKAAAALSGIAGLSGLTTSFARAAESEASAGSSFEEIRMDDIQLSPNAKITVERRGAIVQIGINRPGIQNRMDPEAFAGLAKAYYDYDHDFSLRAAILFGHGDNFSRGIDVDGFRALVETGKPLISGEGMIHPLAKRKPGLTKPLIVAVHGGLDQGELITIPPLPNAADWEAFDAARQNLVPNLSLATPAARYRLAAD
jgi:enoyl-CoA hydratase